ncbi:MAG TPA: hypothetical protein VLB80_00705 [Candidatus Babeliales bacterium]|nr:hypothetical protein [Candidatus Babeliales bacterium]
MINRLLVLVPYESRAIEHGDMNKVYINSASIFAPERLGLVELYHGKIGMLPTP